MLGEGYETAVINLRCCRIQPRPVNPCSIGRSEVTNPCLSGLAVDEGVLATDVVVLDDHVRFGCTTDDCSVPAHLVDLVADSESCPDYGRSRDNFHMTVGSSWDGGFTGLNSHRHRAFQPESFFGGVCRHLGSQHRFEARGVESQILRVHLDDEQIGRRWAGWVLESGEVCLTGEFPGQLGRMEPPGEDSSGHAFDEPFESSFQTSDNVHFGGG